MPYYVHNKQTTRYRVTIEEYQTWTESPDAEEMKPLSEKSERPKPRDKGEWTVSDVTETSRLGVLASALRGIADEIDPKKPTMRDL